MLERRPRHVAGIQMNDTRPMVDAVMTPLTIYSVLPWVRIVLPTDFYSELDLGATSNAGNVAQKAGVILTEMARESVEQKATRAGTERERLLQAFNDGWRVVQDASWPARSPMLRCRGFAHAKPPSL